ncbi:MAG: T9SS type A sorting domain-containing protein, partial [Paludibacteraceae bacterium]|nr:T9SS type A sorting domain-containing protein [Paludibacteraceae bacterium]
DFAGDGDIVIYDAMGKMVMRKKVDSATKSIPLNLTSGIYIVTSKSQNIHSKIVVK